MIADINVLDHPTDPAFRAGTTFEHYHLLEQIGRGGEADVWSAWDTQFNRVVALKVIVPGGAGISLQTPNSSPILDFSREVQLLARLRHPYIVPVYDFGEKSGRRYLVLRYMVGGSLAALMRTRRLTIPEIARFALTIAESLDFMHSRLIVHRDLKPANVLLDSENNPYLTDFGLARELTYDSTLPVHTARGTLTYMSPEQWRSEPIVEQTDLFSFGVLLYEMMTGQLPYQGGVSLAVHQRQTGQAIPDPRLLNPALPVGAHAALRKFTDDIPQNRPGSATEAIQGLFSSLRLDPPIAIHLRAFSPEDVSELELQSQRTDAQNMLRAALQSSNSTKFPINLTDFLVIASAGWDIPSLEPQQLEMLLYGSLYYHRATSGLTEYFRAAWWSAAPESSRRAVCYKLLRDSKKPDTSQTVIDALNLLLDLPPEVLPSDLIVRLTELARAGNSGALGVLARYVPPVKAALEETEAGKTNPRRAAKKWNSSRTPFDTLLAELASSNSSLARQVLNLIVDRRSASAVWDITTRSDEKRSIRFLADLWEGAHTLPPGLAPKLYVRTVARIGYQQIIAHPMDLLARLVALTAGSSVALALILYLSRRMPEFLSAQRIFNAFAPGLWFGLLIGLGGFVTWLIAHRLKVIAFSARLVCATLFGGLGLTWAFANIHTLFYFIPADSLLLPLGGGIFAFGLALSASTSQRSLSAAFAAVGPTAALLLTWFLHLETDNAPLLYFEYGIPTQAVLLSLLFGSVLGLSTKLGWRPEIRTTNLDKIPTIRDKTERSGGRNVV